MPENQIVILCTVPDRGSGEKIAQALVEERLAACVNLVPGVVSTYRWEGAVKQEDELLLLIKTNGARFEAVQERVMALHPYDVPEIIAIPITMGSADYLKWLSDNLK